MGVDFKERELAKQPLSREELLRISGGAPQTLMDRRKPSFRKLGLGDRPLTDDEAIDLMQREPSIIRRPILEIDGEVIVGWNEAEVSNRLA